MHVEDVKLKNLINYLEYKAYLAKAQNEERKMLLATLLYDSKHRKDSQSVYERVSGLYEAWKEMGIKYFKD